MSAFPPELARKLNDLGCVACWLQGTPGTPPEFHHPRGQQGMSQRADHEDAIPLCPPHHRGPAGLKIPSIHGSPHAFIQTFGTEASLIALTQRLIGGGYE